MHRSGRCIQSHERLWSEAPTQTPLSRTRCALESHHREHIRIIRDPLYPLLQVCDSVGRNLEGQRLAGFTGVAAFVRNAFEEALSGILNKRSVDVLLDIKKSQVRGGGGA